jgi:hypothetical protein
MAPKLRWSGRKNARGAPPCSGQYPCPHAAIAARPRGSQGGLKRWSQHSDQGGCDEDTKTVPKSPAPNGTPSDPPADQNRGNLRSTRRCGPMWRRGSLAPSSLRAVHLLQARPCLGKAVDTDGGRIGDGRTPGARNRSRAGFLSTSRTMRPSGSAMKRSIKRSSFKDEARYDAS